MSMITTRVILTIGTDLGARIWLFSRGDSLGAWKSEFEAQF